MLTVEENARELQRLHDPLVSANAHSKATLRVAAEAFAQANERVHRFAACEAALHGTRDPFIDDGRHVSPEAVARAMGEFRRMFRAEREDASAATAGTTIARSR